MNVEALRARAVQLVLRSATSRRLSAAIAAGLAAGFTLGQLVEVSSAPVLLCAAALGGLAYRLAR